MIIVVFTIRDHRSPGSDRRRGEKQLTNRTILVAPLLVSKFRKSHNKSKCNSRPQIAVCRRAPTALSCNWLKVQLSRGGNDGHTVLRALPAPEAGRWGGAAAGAAPPPSSHRPAPRPTLPSSMPRSSARECACAAQCRSGRRRRGGQGSRRRPASVLARRPPPLHLERRATRQKATPRLIVPLPWQL